MIYTKYQKFLESIAGKQLFSQDFITFADADYFVTNVNDRREISGYSNYNDASTAKIRQTVQGENQLYTIMDRKEAEKYAAEYNIDELPKVRVLNKNILKSGTTLTFNHPHEGVSNVTIADINNNDIFFNAANGEKIQVNLSNFIRNCDRGLYTLTAEPMV